MRSAALRGRRRYGWRTGRRDRLAARRDLAPAGRPHGPIGRGRGGEAGPGGEPSRVRASANRRRGIRNGDDDHGRTRRRRCRSDRTCRRLARLSLPRPLAPAADRGPLARRRAREKRPAFAGGGRGAPTQGRDHEGARDRPGGRGRRLLRADEAGRPVPDLLGRSDLDGRRHDDRGTPRAARSRPPDRGPRTDRRGEPPRWGGQHHGRPVRDRLAGRHDRAARLGARHEPGDTGRRRGHPDRTRGACSAAARSRRHSVRRVRDEGDSGVESSFQPACCCS